MGAACRGADAIGAGDWRRDMCGGSGSIRLPPLHIPQKGPLDFLEKVKQLEGKMLFGCAPAIANNDLDHDCGGQRGGWYGLGDVLHCVLFR